ncbi:dynactin subunit 4 [Halyomorpha halys]|uniref:dynactin subunit 4 n=1 Tax=Halyomorpha halys TaxID=286706 RepID=UPI0006D4CF31|nr:dynactin subunit 4 [Halyomorpha halys]
MSYLIQKDYVKYECTCGSLKPISKLYFCRHCLELRCGYCVCHEVDSHYCSNCMEHLPSAEAKFRKNRCNTCFDCPNCFHTLSVRATTRSAEDGTTKTPTKHYYLACFFCRWTSRDVGISDQTTGTGNWPVKELPFSETLSSYLEYYKVLAMRERNLKEKKTYSSPLIRGYSSFTEKFGLTSMIARKRAGLPPLSLGGKENTQSSLPKIVPSVAVEDVEPLPDTYFTDLTKITTLSQRHAYPMLQAETITSLHPQHRHFYIKCSLRCRRCEHNVSKPEYNPGSIKFKIQLAAYYHMPEVRIMTFEPLKVGKASEIVLKITNPTQHLTSLQFGPLINSEDKKNLKTEEISETKKENNFFDLPRPIRTLQINTEVELPQCSVILPPRDDAAEYDDSADTHNFQDDTKVVVWRKGNKVAVKMKITPQKGIGGEESVFGFSMEYGYVNTMILEQKQPQRAEIQVNLFISPGLVSSSEE